MHPEQEEAPLSRYDDAGASSTVDSAGTEQDRENVVERSLLDDVEALVADARTYFDAELSFQKSRAAFVGETVRHAAIMVVGGAIVALVALIVFGVGLVLALTPLITAWGATAVVTAALLIAVLLMLRSASNRWKQMRRSLAEEEPSNE